MRSERFRLIQRQIRWTKRWIRRLAREPRPMAFRTSWGFAFVHLDSHPGRRGKWRATWLDFDWEPIGHGEADDFASALQRAREEGADLFDAVTLQSPSPTHPQEKQESR